MASRRLGGRARVTLIAVVVALVGFAASVVGVLTWDGDAVTAAYRGWRDGGPRGALAADGAVRAAALRAWSARTGMPAEQARWLEHTTGPVRMVWAGRAGAVAAAVLTQPAEITPVELPGLDEGVPPASDVWGYLRIGPDGTATVSAMSLYLAVEVPEIGALGGWVDRAEGVGLVFDLGVPLVVSTGVEFGPDGRYGRTGRPLEFDAGGVAVLDLAPPALPPGVVVGPASRPLTEIYGIAGGVVDEPVPLEPGWSAPPLADGPRVIPIAGTDPAVGRGLVDLVATAAIERLSAVPNVSYATAAWALAGQLADGTIAVVSAVEVSGTGRLVSLVGTAYQDHGVLDLDATLPVAVRLPGGGGWVVAAPRAALRYRPHGGAWRTAGFEAALVPSAGPVEVEVRRGASRAVVVLP